MILDEAAWDLVEFEALGTILSDRPVRERFLDGATEGSLRTIVEAKVKPLRLGRVLAETERHPFLEPFIPNRLVVDGIRTHPSLKSAIAEAEKVMAAELQAERLLGQKKLDERLSAQADEWARRTEALATDRDAALQRVAETEDRMRAQSKAHSAAVGAQLRQAQFDALRALVDLIEELRLSAGVSEAAKALASDGQRRLREFGITVEGRVGDRGTFDHRFFQAVGGSTSAQSEIVAPAYLIDLDSGVTPLRYGQTQSVQK